MIAHGTPADDYREDLHRWSCMLSSHRVEQFQAELATNPAGEGARMHLTNSVSERRNMVRQELGLVALVFPDLNVHIDAFLRSAPRTAFDLEHSDTENCLRWMADTLPLTPQQACFVGYQLGEFAVLAAARRDRDGYVSFQRLLDESSAGLEQRAKPGTRSILHFNPTRAWGRLVLPESASGGSGEPRDVLFYAAGGVVRCLSLGPEQMVLVRKLSELAPCTLEEYAADAGDAGGARRELAGELARQGVVAITG